MPLILNGSTGISGTDGSAGTPALQGTDGNTGMFFPAPDQIAFAEGGVEAMRLDASGNVGIGTSSLSLGVVGLTVYRPGGASVALQNATTGTAAVSGFQLQGGSGGDAYLWNYSNSFIAIGTNNTERARITQFGDLLVGTTSSDARITSRSSDPNIAALGTRSVSGDLGTPHLYITKFDNNTTTAQVFIRFVANNGNNPCGQINANGANAAAFGTWSDARLKENIVDLPPQLENICALRPVEFDYKDGSGHQVGFIAQDMQAVYPDVVAAGSDEMLQVTGWSKTEARIVKALQELKAENDALKARVAALEAR